MLRRPLGITVLAALYILGGLLAAAAFLLQVWLLVRTTWEMRVPSDAILQSAAFTALLSALPALMLGVAFTFLGYKLLKGSRYAYYASAALSALSLVTYIVTMKIAGAIASALILLYLLKPSTRRYFLEDREASKATINTERQQAEANI